MKSLSIPLQYLVAAALEVTDVNIFKPSGFTMGMNNWNIAQMRIFGNIQQLLEKKHYKNTLYLAIKMIPVNHLYSFLYLIIFVENSNRYSMLLLVN